MSKSADLKSIAHHYLEAGWVRGDAALVRLLAAPDFRFSTASRAPHQDIDGYLELLEAWRGAFGELELTLHDLLQEGTQVAAHYELSGRHIESVYGVAASGRRGALQIMSFLDFAGERVVAHRAVIDFVSSIAMGEGGGAEPAAGAA